MINVRPYSRIPKLFTYLLTVLSLSALALLTGCGSGAGEGEGNVASVGAALCTGITLSASPTSPRTIGSQINLTVSPASCGAGQTAEYRFVFTGPSGVQTQIRNWGASNTTTWNTTGLTPGSYSLLAYARAAGTNVSFDSFAYLPSAYYLGNVCNAVNTFTFSPTSPQTVGTSITLSATATCPSGGTPQFRYAYQLPGSSTYTFIGPYGAASQTWDTTGLPSGAYSLIVYTRANGNTSTYEGYKYGSYQLGATCSGAAISASPTSPQPTGTTVTLTGTATCSSPQYQFSFRPTGGAWTTLRTYASTPTYAWNTTGVASGGYELRVEARNAGNTGAAEASSSITYTVGDTCGSVTLSTSPASPQSSGAVIGLTGVATCTGGVLPEYRFAYRLSTASTATQIQAFSSASTADWNTAGLSAGTYYVTVETRAVGRTATEGQTSLFYSLISTALSTPSAGLGNHTCARVNNGTARCWGANDSGQLGNGSTTASSTPVTVTGVSNVVQVASGVSHSCALIGDGTVRCWGLNTDGQLGNNTKNNSSTAVTVSGLSDATAITAGTAHTCALRTGGAVSCWGNNSYGQLGAAGAAYPNSLVPVAVTTAAGSSSVLAGGFHTCALISGGVKCWGDNSLGQLGNGGSPEHSFTAVDATGLTSGVTALSAGDSHTCAIVSGAAKCWGDNTYGQLGDGTTTSSNVPVAVTGGITTMSDIGAGFAFSCARLTNSTVRCWGRNAEGEVGDGTFVDKLTPTAVLGISTASTLTVGSLHACSLLTNNSVKCWGYNANGQLGNGSTSNASTPVTVTFP